MKKILLSVVSISISILTIAQKEAPKKSDTTKIKIAPIINFTIVNNEFEGERTDSSEQNEFKVETGVGSENLCDSVSKTRGTGFGFLVIGYTNYLNDNGNFSFDGNYENYKLNFTRSHLIQLNLIRMKSNLVKDKLMWHNAFGVEFHSYAFENNASLMADTNQTVFNVSNISYDKNFLNINYLNYSTMFEANIKKKFHIGIGANIAVNIGRNHSNIDYEINKTKYELKTKDKFNINPVRASLIGKVGYKNWNFFVTYSPQQFGQLGELFKQSANAEKVHPISFGISLIN